MIKKAVSQGSADDPPAGGGGVPIGAGNEDLGKQVAAVPRRGKGAPLKPPPKLPSDVLADAEHHADDPPICGGPPPLNE